MTVKTDIAEQHVVRRDANGYQVERIFYIDGLAGVDSARLINAMITSGIPQYGDPHPFVPDIQVTSVTAEPLSNSGQSARVSVMYSEPSEDDLLETGQNQETVELSTNLADEETFFDVDGNLLIAEWRATPNFATPQLIKYGSTNVERPQMRVTLTRIEPAPPKEAISKYLGKLNLSEWSGFPAGTWLCSGINAREDRGEYKVDYSFVYRAEGWKVEIIIGLTAEQGNEAPIDVDIGNGFARYEVYDRANFNELGLTF